MKRMLLSLVACCAVFALGAMLSAQDADASGAKANRVYYVGTVESIDKAARTFTIVNKNNEKTVIIVTPETEFELERGRHMHDQDVPFSELKVHDWVRVKARDMANEKNVARDVNIYRDKIQ